MRPDLNDDRTWKSYARAFVAAALICTVIYGWSVLTGDTGLGGM